MHTSQAQNLIPCASAWWEAEPVGNNYPQTNSPWPFLAHILSRQKHSVAFSKQGPLSSEHSKPWQFNGETDIHRNNLM